ncbi:hypothetical protein MXD61_06455 [Frankia sp. AgPm24]|nr:hypothetical protein [Frankia sp. AgPm24]
MPQLSEVLAATALRHRGVGVPADAPYVPARADEVCWGLLPNAASRPVLRVPSGAAVRFDTIIDILPGLKAGDSYPRGQVFLFH